VKDTRIFKVTRTTGRVQYCSKRAVSGMFASGFATKSGRTVAKVEATNAAATDGWSDVTERFRNPPAPPANHCNRHPEYTGTRKPGYRWYKDKMCKCWRLYGDLHPDYPKHSDYCHELASDPEHCSCKMAAKLLG
jgi:hypothetical protein